MKRWISLFALLFAYRSAHAEPRKVGDFHAVDLAGALEVEVTVGKPIAVDVTGDADLVPKVTTTVKNGVLVIETPKKLPNKAHLKVTIAMPDVTSLALSGAGQLTATGVGNAGVSVELSGAGQVTVSGTTGDVRISVPGTGEVNAKKLQAKTAMLDLGGTGQVSAVASDAVEASLSGTGQIDVTGKPAKVKKHMTGVGDIHIR